MFYVTSLANLQMTLDAVCPSRLISLLPQEEINEKIVLPPTIPKERHLSVGVNDIAMVTPGLVAPARDHVTSLIRFLDEWRAARDEGREEGGIVVHCRMGMSRSAAAAYIGLCMLAPPGRERAIAQYLRAKGAHFQPNILIVELADEILGRGGRMGEAIDEIGLATSPNLTDWVLLEPGADTE